MGHITQPTIEMAFFTSKRFLEVAEMFIILRSSVSDQKGCKPERVQMFILTILGNEQRF